MRLPVAALEHTSANRVLITALAWSQEIRERAPKRLEELKRQDVARRSAASKLVTLETSKRTASRRRAEGPTTGV
jgi:hypothetical protein